MDKTINKAITYLSNLNSTFVLELLSFGLAFLALYIVLKVVSKEREE